ncbi:hypothetical protein LJ655_03100 [Paraburkholderia sp. MMS20-SJTN17]|uniref:Uncharacterized protein n=1 Tax=Paraburkholderia translucens TaxID=2886945 RepID=A0ABS8K817_9BURK|nr:hypothetical protein [Paraburkholderia sp. MMS20-SJTN17]MCC8400888.1 hypothetical protein [Paraburkholderia sp. MMS20-SJTN17]
MKHHAARGMCLLCHTVATSTSDDFESVVDIAARVGNPDYQLSGMWGRWMCHYLNGEYARAIPLAQRFSELAATSSRRCDHLAGGLPELWRAKAEVLVATRGDEALA